VNYEETMHTLEEMGTAQNRKIYGRHGVGENMFGVSFGNLKELKKKVKKDHELAIQLWNSGNHDARNFATMIADPKQVDEALLDSWVQDLDNYVITDSFVGLTFRTKFAQEKAMEWISTNEEYVARAGWHLLSHISQNDEDLPVDFFETYLEIIENDIQQQQNRTREGMNNALIAIGIRNPALMLKALSVAENIGEVEVDHGDTSCKTPFAPDYIERTVNRKKSKGQWEE
jgi:3-methyladenine DNA glycosylase AlkD